MPDSKKNLSRFTKPLRKKIKLETPYCVPSRHLDSQSFSRLIFASSHPLWSHLPPKVMFPQESGPGVVTVGLSRGSSEQMWRHWGRTRAPQQSTRLIPTLRPRVDSECLNLCPQHLHLFSIDNLTSDYYFWTETFFTARNTIRNRPINDWNPIPSSWSMGFSRFQIRRHRNPKTCQVNRGESERFWKWWPLFC